MDNEQPLPIGVVSRRTGLTIKAIRLYADRGIVRPVGRNSAGHRVFDSIGVAQLELVRTLRQLGLDLTTVKRVLDREQSLAEVAATQAKAIALQIRVLQTRQAVLTVAAQGATRQGLELMTRAGKLSRIEQQQLIDEFTAGVFGGKDADPDLVGMARSLRPELPDEPSPAQLAAWVELAELLQDGAFRMTMRLLVSQHVADRAAAGGGVPGRDLAAVIREQAGHAIATGIHPLSTGADPIAQAVIARYHAAVPDDQVPADLLGWLQAVNDPQRERYLRLLSVINDWPPPQTLAPVLDWTTRAVRARLAG